MRNDRVFDMSIPDDECDMDAPARPRKSKRVHVCGDPNEACDQDCVDRAIESKVREEELLRIERIAMIEILHRWVIKYAPGCKPGGWEYDHDAADLCQTTAHLLKMGDPWEDC